MPKSLSQPIGLVLILIASICMQTSVVEAHATLGRSIGEAPFRVRDSDTNGRHLPGPTGYVWPGSGSDRYLTLSSDYALSGKPPGYQSPFGNYPFNAPTSWYQLRGNSYSPFGAILTSTEEYENIGDLIFALNFTLPEGETPSQFATTFENLHPGSGGVVRYNDIIILIPPEFNMERIDKSHVVTTITSSYGGYIRGFTALGDISVGILDKKDPFGPGWGFIFINGTIQFNPQNGYREWYYIRVNAVIAPKIAGRYFFKMFLNQSFPTISAPLTGLFCTVPVENYPCLLVKGEIDPGIIEGTIRYGGWNQTLYGQPIRLPGRVRAVGVAEDPYNPGVSLGRKVEARAYFNASAQGHFELEGLAPGVYDLYASAAGYPETLVRSGVQVFQGKSFHIDLYLTPGPVIHGRIFSKHGFGETPWPSQRPIMIEIYDRVTAEQVQPIDEAGLVSFSPINLTHAPYISYVVGDPLWRTVEQPFDTPPRPKKVAFPWEGDKTGSVKDQFGLYNGVGPAQYWWVDPAGEFTNGGGETSFVFQFGREGMFGVPHEFDGHVPQVYATWIDSLEPGTYHIRAWVNGYVQTDASGVFKNYQVQISKEEWPGDIYVTMDLQLNGVVNKTVHFHDLANSIIANPLRGPDPGRYLIAELYDSENRLVSFNFSYVGAGNSSYSILLNGLGMAGPNNRILPGGAGTFGIKYSLYRYRSLRDYGIPPGVYLLRVYMRGYVQQEFEKVPVSLSGAISDISNHLIRGAGINFTLYSKDWQHPPIGRNWTWDGSDVSILVFKSDGVFMGKVECWDGSSWITPTQAGSANTLPYDGWKFFNKLKFNGSTTLEAAGPDSVTLSSAFSSGCGKATSWFLIPYFGYGFLYATSTGYYRDEDFNSTIGLESGNYQIRAYTYGYIQKDDVVVYAEMSNQVDLRINLIQGLNFTFTVVFKKEGLLSETPYNLSARLRVFDENGQLISASTVDTATPPFKAAEGTVSNDPSFPGSRTRVIPYGTRMLIWKIAGFNRYAEPRGTAYYDYGIDGYPNYGGSWTVELDFISLHRHDTWHPAAPGLLMGESFHLIGEEFGYVEKEYSYNHLGPYRQRETLVIPNAPLSGEASVIFEVDENSYIAGYIFGFTYSDEIRPLSWSHIYVSGSTGEYVFHSYDSFYEAYLKPGSYTLTIVGYAPGHLGFMSQKMDVALSDAEFAESINFYLERSFIPVPEFAFGSLTLTLMVTASCLYMAKRCCEGKSK